MLGDEFFDPQCPHVVHPVFVIHPPSGHDDAVLQLMIAWAPVALAKLTTA